MSSKKTIRKIWKNEINYFDKLCDESNIERDCSIAEYIKLTTEKGNLSCIPVRCNLCKYLVTTTSISNLDKRKRAGCPCNRNIPWSDRWDQFCDECETRNVKPHCTKEKFIELTRKKQGNSCIPLQCNDCKGIVRTTTISSFLAGHLGCSCNTKIPWSDRWDQFCDECETRNVKPHCTKEKFVDLTTKNGAYSCIPLQCNDCGEIVRTTDISNFLAGHLGCPCNTNIPWSDRWDEFCYKCESRNVKPHCTKEKFVDLTTKNGAYSCIPLQCNDCGEIVRNTTISSFLAGHLGCSCNTSIPWSDRWDQFCDECETRNVKPHCTKEKFIRITIKDGNKSYIPLQCNVCEEIVKTTDISNFLAGKLGCKCALGRSEKMCGDILHELFGDKYPFLKVHPDWLKYSEDSTCKGEIDFYCEELKLTFEYNGIQHYEYQPNFFHRNGYHIFEYQQEKDEIRRQKCKENGIVLIEVPYTYNYEDKYAMKSFIMNEIEVKTGYEWIFVKKLV